MPRHVVRPAGEAAWSVPPNLEGHTEGFRRWTVVDESVGAVHTGFAIAEFDPGGRIDWHVHSYEESLFVLEGEIVLFTSETAVLLRPGDYALVVVGQPHALANLGRERVRLAALSSPQPRPAHGGDTFFVPALPEPEPVTVNARDPRTRAFGHIEPGHMEPGKQSQDLLEVSASMRTALLVYSGITVKMMIDSDLGSQLSTMFMVQYEAMRGIVGGHDHPLEETYLILEGEVEATFDGQEYRLVPGDVAWAGVGCVHAFANPHPRIVRWLETQAPAPPPRHSYRFARDWDYLRDATATQAEEVR
ncbi:MAG TPA: cupin domain-containing protein [Actinomycetota bacterium]|nr:cupin domain-containing protein [Actinomycetota bacterium]